MGLLHASVGRHHWILSRQLAGGTASWSYWLDPMHDLCFVVGEIVALNGLASTKVHPVHTSKSFDSVPHMAHTHVLTPRRRGRAWCYVDRSTCRQMPAGSDGVASSAWDYCTPEPAAATNTSTPGAVAASNTSTPATAVLPPQQGAGGSEGSGSSSERAAPPPPLPPPKSSALPVVLAVVVPLAVLAALAVAGGVLWRQRRLRFWWHR